MRKKGNDKGNQTLVGWGKNKTAASVMLHAEPSAAVSRARLDLQRAVYTPPALALEQRLNCRCIHQKRVAPYGVYLQPNPAISKGLTKKDGGEKLQRRTTLQLRDWQCRRRAALATDLAASKAKARVEHAGATASRRGADVCNSAASEAPDRG